MQQRKSNKDKKILIFSGAGISAESGISTFRDANGLWENHDIDKVCSEDTWKQNFELVHEFYNQRRMQLSGVKPNKAHEIVAQIQQEYPQQTHIITQNVDDLFERAGCVDVMHVHGELTKMRCVACGHAWEIGYLGFDTKHDRCPKCSSLKGVRPDIVFFGGNAPFYRDMYRAFESASNKESIVIIIGTMGNIVFVEGMIKDKPCTKIVNNLEQSAYLNPHIFDYSFYEKATLAMPKIYKIISQIYDSRRDF